MTPVLIAAALASSLLLAPPASGADPAPSPTRHEPALDQGAAKTSASAASRALGSDTVASGAVRGYPREQVLSTEPENPGDKSGATVEGVSTGSLDRLPLRSVREAAAVGYVAPRGDLRLALDDPAAIAALNSLLQQGVSVRRTADGGSAIVPASARGKAVALARTYDVSFDATRLTGTTALHRARVAAAVTAGELFALREMNFEVTPVSTAVLDAGFDWSTVDVLFVSSGLEYGELGAAARTALDVFLADGHGLVGRGVTGAELGTAAGLLAAKPVEGNGDANGVVRVVNSGTVTAGSSGYGFVYAPVWFTDLGPEVRVEQSYATGNPLVSGHWRPLGDGTGGPSAAAGRPSVVSAPQAVLFGTEPLFRDHPKGQFPEVARALYGMADT